MKSILLGSGLSGFINHFEIIKSWPFSDFVDFPIHDLLGHERVVYQAAYAECEYIVVSGKLHYYECSDMEQMRLFYKNLLAKFEISDMLITASSAGLVPQIEVGKWYQVSGLIIGNGIQLDRGINNRVQSDSSIVDTNRASYAFQAGPSLGTLAEYKMLYEYGAQLVGMSILPEWHLLNDFGVRTEAFSIPVFNYAPLTSIVEPSHQEVIDIAEKAVTSLVQIFKQFIKADTDVAI